MNKREEALLLVAAALEQNPKLSYFELKDGVPIRWDISQGQIEYVVETLREIAKDLPHKRPARQKKGNPAKTPVGRELFDLQAEYLLNGKYQGKGELRRLLIERYPDAGVEALKKAETRIRKGREIVMPNGKIERSPDVSLLTI